MAEVMPARRRGQHRPYGITSIAKGRDQRPAFDTMLKDAVRRLFDVLMVWSIDRLRRSLLHVETPRRNSMLLALRFIPTSRPSKAPR